MGHQIIRQPDDKLAVFSSSTDTWILFDVSPEELLDYYAEKAGEDARRQTQVTLDLVLSGQQTRAYYQFTMSFDEANQTSAEHEGPVWEGEGWTEETYAKADQASG